MAHKIIHVVLGKANPNRMNGVNKVVNRLATTQVELGHDVEVWGITKDTTHNYPERNYETILFQDQQFKFLLDAQLKKAIENLNKETVTFHLHGGYLLQFFSLSRVLVKHQMEYVYTPHGAFNLVAMKRSATKKKIYNQFLESYIVRHAKVVHSIGASELSGTEATFKNVKQVLIPNGQEPLEKQGDSIKQNEFPVFGFVGRLDKHTKGLDLLLNGFAQFLNQSNTPAELWLLGDGPDRNELEALVQKLTINNRVQFKGAVYSTEKMNLMQQFDYLCLSSRNEGLPGVVLEAAAFGVPAIVSKETNLGDYINTHQSGIVLSKNTTEQITKALFRGAENRTNGLLNQQSENAKEMIARDFCWKHISQKHIAVYES
ncbi:MAG: glycosyltransferase family 4 protein [Salibacteraceae bacterium]|nr:glycosyltransferase family 4 protein [Salibacteraceae bacterium]|tara:strand:+ start:7295 stop:8416 length:1122 start_codon:yes stop_codon:yes gene_type:complete